MGWAERALRRWTSGAARHGRKVILATLLATAAIAYYTADNLAMQTDITEMLSGDLEWRKANSHFDKVLPGLHHNIVIVVTGSTADRARDGAAALARRLTGAGGNFSYVFYPPAEPFFRKNGLLYRSVEDLDALSARLAEAQPLLAALNRDRSVRGLFGILADATDEVARGEVDGHALTLPFARIASTIESTVNGRGGQMSWLDLLGEEVDRSDRRQVIIVHPKPDYASLSPVKTAVELIRDAVRDLRLDASEGYGVSLTGGLYIEEEELATIQETAGFAGLISLVLVGIVIFAGLRSGRLVFATLAVLLVGLVWTAGFAAFAIGHLNIISIAFAVLFLGLSVDYGIQYGLRYREAVDGGVANEGALIAAGVGVGRAMFLSAVTSAIGFYAFVPTVYVGMAELGIIAGTGIFIAFFLYLTLLPAILAVYPLRRRTAPVSGRVFAAVCAWLAARPRRVVTLSLVLVAGGLALMPSLRFEFDPVMLKDPNAESVRTFLDLAKDSDTSPYEIGVLARDAREAHEMAERLARLKEVDRVTTPASYVPADQRIKLDIVEGMALFLSPVFEGATHEPAATVADKRRAMARLRTSLARLTSSDTAPALAAAARRLADALDGVAARTDADGPLLAVERALLSGLPERLAELEASLGAGPVTGADLPDALRRRIFASDGSHLVSVHPAEDVTRRDALRRFVEAVSDVAPRATDLPVVILRAGESVVRAFQEAGAFAALAIIVVLVVVLRKLADVALVLAPVVLAAVLSLAATVVFDVPFNFANVIALPLLLALGVDFGIHLVLRYRECGRSLAALVASSTPRAIFYSGLTTMCSFGSLIVSHHRGMASMGWLLLVSITLALVSALVILPALIGWQERRPSVPRGNSAG